MHRLPTISIYLIFFSKLYLVNIISNQIILTVYVKFDKTYPKHAISYKL